TDKPEAQRSGAPDLLDRVAPGLGLGSGTPRVRCARGLGGWGIVACALLLVGASAVRASFGAEPVTHPIDVGSRVEMFVDDYLVASSKDVALRINPPTKREVVLTTDQPWEATTSAYYSMLRDDDGKVRLYY